MSNNFYSVLWVDKNSSADEIKKAYRKKAMEYHPDRNKWDAKAEEKFKEVNQAYDTLWDASKKKQYDMFGSTWWSNFWWWSRWWNPFWWWRWWFEDMFWWAGNWGGWFDFDMSDLFWWAGQRQAKQKPKEPVSLDFEKTYEVPIFDLILWCKIEVKWVYGQIAKLKIPASTKPGTKFRVKGFGKKEPGKEWNLLVKIEWLMPKNISEVDMSMLERIRENIGY